MSLNHQGYATSTLEGKACQLCKRAKRRVPVYHQCLIALIRTKEGFGYLVIVSLTDFVEHYS